MNYEQLKELALNKSQERHQTFFEHTHELLMRAKQRRKEQTE